MSSRILRRTAKDVANQLLSGNGNLEEIVILPPEIVDEMSEEDEIDDDDIGEIGAVN